MPTSDSHVHPSLKPHTQPATRIRDARLPPLLPSTLGRPHAQQLGRPPVLAWEGVPQLGRACLPRPERSVEEKGFAQRGIDCFRVSLRVRSQPGLSHHRNPPDRPRTLLLQENGLGPRGSAVVPSSCPTLPGPGLSPSLAR